MSLTVFSDLSRQKLPTMCCVIGSLPTLLSGFQWFGQITTERDHKLH